MSAVVRESKTLTTNLSDPAVWLEQYGDYLFRHAFFRLRDRTAAEDVVQETLLAAVAARDRFAGQANEKTWLVGILKHKIIDYFRRSKNTMSFETEVDLDIFDSDGEWRSEFRPAVWSDPAALLETKDFQRVISDCLTQLPEHLRRAFILREIDGLSSEEICNLLSVTPTNLSVMLHRARVTLQSLVEKCW